jgi:signal peptidase I
MNSDAMDGMVNGAAPAPEMHPSEAEEQAAQEAALAQTRQIEEFLALLQGMATILVIALFILTFLAQPYRIPSASMEDTLLVGDFLLVNKMVYAPPGPWRSLLPYRSVQRDDVVVFHYPVAPATHLVKRVIGLPQDRIHLVEGRVYVNDDLALEPFARNAPSDPGSFRDNFPSLAYTDPGVDMRWWMEMRGDIRDGELVVPAGQYFVLGDNRKDSLDSRYWGFVPEANIVGEPFLVYFSLHSPAASELTGLPDDRLTHGHSLWTQTLHVARWDRIFHIIH